jgi:hypothetical protein
MVISVSYQAYGAAISVNSVGTYSPNPNALALNNAASNSAASGLTLAAFQALVANAYTTNTGGVIDAQSQTAPLWQANGTTYGDGAANPISANYGASLSNILQFWRTDVGSGLNANTNNGTNTASGNAYIGIQGTSSPVNLAFGTGLSALGLTEVPRGALRLVTLTAVLDNASTIVGSTESINADNTPGAIFWGFRAPAGRSITGLSIVSTDGAGAAQFARFDDFGFVVVPEPASFVLIGLGGLGLLALRRRRN